MINRALKTGLTLAIGAASSYSLASGFAINEQSVSGMGTAFAGRSSSADDATMVFGNPAGMSRLKREQISAGAAMIYARTDIDDARSTSVAATTAIWCRLWRRPWVITSNRWMTNGASALACTCRSA